MIHPRKGMNKHAPLTAQTSILDEARACKGHDAEQKTRPIDCIDQQLASVIAEVYRDACGTSKTTP